MKCPECGTQIPDQRQKVDESVTKSWSFFDRSFLDIVFVVVVLLLVYRLGQVQGGLEMLKACAVAASGASL